MIERELTVNTPEGSMPTFIYHPEHGGSAPVVLYLMDAPSIRPALKEMAMRLASAGYYVMMPYLYYRGGPYREFGASDEDMHKRRELMDTVTPTNILSDAAALLDVAASDPAADDNAPMGAVGFCMSGGLVVALAKHYPQRVAAVASIHGAWMVRDTDDSPHLGLEQANAEMYFGWCDNDTTAPVETMETFVAALNAAGTDYTLDFIDYALHGYAPYHGANYDRQASELHWERVHRLFRRKLLGC